MQYSGILVRSLPGRLDQCATEVAACEGVDVYVRDEATSRLVAVIEGATLGCHEDRLRAIRELPAVATAELVYHCSDDADHDESDHAGKESLP